MDNVLNYAFCIALGYLLGLIHKKGIQIYVNTGGWQTIHHKKRPSDNLLKG